eukprot:TRINITY_DN4438_c0_g1_i2.p1 TRINITY_DN4438_c0_g1~~TRINITY_DN4438_c0_g1_i2.p1  ORF type:complete len:754 (+),score=146.03 TRINITY_DN4438_c0_g1_i2:245-2506(+)
MTAEVLIQRESVTLESIEFSTPHGDTCKKLRRLLQLDTDVELDALELILSTLSARASNTGSWYWTYGSKIIWSNANHMLFEKTREEFKGEFDEFLSFVLPQDRVIINDWVEAVMARLKNANSQPTGLVDLPELTFRILTPGNKIKWIGAKGKALAEGGQYFIFGINTDLTPQVELEEQRIQIETLTTRLQEQNKFKRDFVHFIDNVAHEMRNPLQGVLGNIQLMSESASELRDVGEKLSKSSTEISHHIEKLHGIRGSIEQSLKELSECCQLQQDFLDDSLSLSKIGSFQVQLKSERCCLSKLASSLACIYRHSNYATKNNVQLSLCFEDEVGNEMAEGDETTNKMFTVNSDAIQIKSILSNLLSNSLKFTEQGYVQLTIRRLQHNESKAKFRFSVRDTGCGIDAEDIGLIFERFRQSRKSTHVHRGSGLGLCICNHLVKLFDPTASIKVESTKGVGSCFSFELTLDLPSKTDPPISSPTLSPVFSPRASRMRTSTPFLNVPSDTPSPTSTKHHVSASSSVTKIVNTNCRTVDENNNGNNNDSSDPCSTSTSPESSATLSYQASTEESSSPIGSPRDEPVVFRYHRSDTLPIISVSQHLEDSLSPQKLAVICEDNSINSAIIKRFCEKEGYRVVQLADGKQSMDFFESLEKGNDIHLENITLVFLDVLMPYYTGYEIARRIRQIESECELSRHIPIIGLSGSFRQDDRLEGTRAGFNEFLVKPVSHQVIKKYLLQYGNEGNEQSCTETSAICT